jgi:EmrB/QacA subfamily drug resistance transporter
VSKAADKRTILIVAALSTFLAGFTGSSVNIALPSIGSELGMDAVSLGWVATAYILASATLLLPFGRLSDIHGRKRIFTLGIIVYIISSLLLAFVPSAGLLIALRVGQGIGGAMIFSTAVAIVTSVFPVGERGRALGITTAMTYLGLTLGPVLGGILTQHFGWRSIFWATVPLGAVAVSLIRARVKGEWAEARGERFDTAGSLVYGFALVATIYGFSLLPQRLGIWLVVAGVSGIFAFVRQQTRSRFPLIDIALFKKNRVFAFSNLALLLNYSAAFAVGFLMSLYLQYIKGLSPQDAGLTLVAMPAVQAGLSPLAGRLSDRIDPRILASIGMGLITTGLALFTTLDENTSWGFIIGGLVTIGAGFGFFTSPNTNAIMSSVRQRLYGVASATLATMRQVGMMFSVGIAMLLLALYIGRVEVTPQYHPLFLESTRTAFIIFTILCSVGIFASLARGNTRREHPSA